MFTDLEKAAPEQPASARAHRHSPADAQRPTTFKWLGISHLERYAPQWRELAENAATPNPYYSPGIFLAYAHTIGLPDNLAIASVWSGPADNPRLDAMGFYVRDDFRWGWPVRTWVSWTNPYFLSSEPLVRKSCQLPARRVLFDGLSNNRADRTLLLGKAHNGSSARPLALVDEHRGQAPILDRQAIVASHQRAALLSNWSVDDYTQAGISKKFRTNVGRSMRKLEAIGALKFETVTSGPELTSAVDDFLALEGRGWKGKHGTAMNSCERDLRFARRAFNAQTTPGVSCDILSLDGKAIAVNVNLTVADCLFGFKSAFDESHGKLSPGNVAHYLAAKSILSDRRFKLADSSTVPGHPIESVWPDRLAAGLVLQSVGAPISRLQFRHCLKAERLGISLRARGRDLYNTVSRRKVTTVKQQKPFAEPPRKGG